MNKGQRMEETKRRHKKRLSALGLSDGPYYMYRHQAKPCSCVMCRPPKYQRSTGQSKQQGEEAQVR